MKKIPKTIYGECEICAGSFIAMNKKRKYCDECGKNPERARRKIERDVARNFAQLYGSKIHIKV